MYSVRVRDHVMIAHSLKGEAFGPAQNLHGATYVVDAEFRRASLDADAVVVDIAKARQVLGEVLAGLGYRNLDEEPAFRGANTTTEHLARVVFEGLAERLRAGALGPAGGAIELLKVTLGESHVAWAAYEGNPRARG